MMRVLRCCLLCVLASMAFGTARAAEAPFALTAEYMTDPVGIDVPRPRLAWKLGFHERGAVQRAWQVQVAAAPDAFGSAPLWDSGRVDTADSVHVPYGGPLLAPGQRVYWRVRAWNGADAVSPWSVPAYFEAGLVRPAEWRARWITADPVAAKSAPGPAMLLRRQFRLDRPVVRARLYITSLGVYEAQVNGRQVTDQVLRPGWTSYDKRLHYQTYDVTGHLKQGDNAIGAMLGDGWYRGGIGFNGRDHYGTRRALLAELRVTHADGTATRIVTDDRWRASTGAVLSSDLLQGETYDARLEQPGWAAPGFGDQAWRTVAVLDHPKDALAGQAAPGVRRIMEVRPQRILRTPQGDTVFDFGQNMAGWVRLAVRGPAGTTIRLRHAEVLDKDGNFYTANLRTAAQTHRYTLKGGPGETWEPRFTFQGFRYVAVDGFPGRPGLEALTAIVLHSDLGVPNRWESSHPLLNRLVRNTEWGQRGNFLEVPTDCPQRNERLGWTGDVQVFARTATYNFGSAAFLAKWMDDLAADQKADGSIPFVIPDIVSRKKASIDGAAGWSDAVTVVPWVIYQAYGDRAILARHYGSMKAWVDHVARRAPDGVWNTGFQFGDWLAYQAPAHEARDYPGATTGKDLVATAYFARSADLLARSAAVLGKDSDARHYAALAARVRLAFNREFVTASGRVGENTQTAYALALRFDLLPAEQRAAAARRLAGAVAARKDHLSTGFLGTPALLFALGDHGQIETAWRLLTRETYPSWLYPVKQGATTIWERWDGIRPDGGFQDAAMNSFNHYAYGAVVEWMYAVAAGIDTDPAAPGYRRSIVRPRPGGGLTWVDAAVETPYGRLAARWDLRGGTMRLAVAVPPNTRSTVVLPGAVLEELSLDGEVPPGARQTGNDVTLRIGAGHYLFTYPWRPATPGAAPDGAGDRAAVAAALPK
ncbi:glycoside hydrolase family 78 protein [Pseudoduganella sp. SL102]|uniref:glycoside hydrolase family 78 protein n=1 Tax=Pseudoduganella sp. SL102 TaxID=2995154 RepID=UPI00248BD5DF|nr:glycoside hydrolase family 78 protein [Pseudoduganella sp. SL102]WBS00441.1 glycoside hydrolase family 78 protein [Pseudoduganella sp. SL102]